MSRVKAIARRILLRVFPAGSRVRRHLGSIYLAYRAATVTYAGALQARPVLRSGQSGLRTYSAWRRQERRLRRHAVSNLSYETAFAVVVETSPGDPARLLRRTVRSVSGQIGSHGRVITAATGTLITAALENSSEDFVVVLRAGSVLDPYALSELAKRHRVDPALKVLTFDSDLSGAFRRRHSPRFRPEWSPEMLLGANYIGRAFAVRSNLVKGVENADVSDRGVWRVLLAGGLSDRIVGRVPRILLTEKPAQSSPDQADADMIREVLAGQGETVETQVVGDVVRVRFIPAAWPTVSVVIPTRHCTMNLSRLLPSLDTTDYPSFDVTIIDNGTKTPEADAWYREREARVSPSVIWWTESPFNYSRVNNVAVRQTSGDVIVMLNDDTQIVDPGWLKEMVGSLLRNGVGTVGVQHRQGDGLIQHGGVLVGPGGFADNLFSGMSPDSPTLIGPTSWYRNTLAVTGACVAVRRTDFEAAGGLDERFILCGSDVVLGLDQVIQGRRNVVIPFDTVRHYESITRGTDVPAEDFYASYFRYHPWLQNGDPYSSPSVSRLSAVPRFNSASDISPLRLALSTVGRNFAHLAQSSSISQEANSLMYKASVSEAEVEAVHALHGINSGRLDIKSINWFVPDIDMPFFGGLNTAFRLADKLARENGVVNRFVMLAAKNPSYVRGALAAAFPKLGECEVVFYDGSDRQIANLPPADAAVATLWLTAPHVAKAPGIKRKFYLMQDYEPMFYPASTMFAMAEESYRLGLYGLCNTASMHKIYTKMYGGQAAYFVPAVDRSIYHTLDRRQKDPDEPVTIFAYARDHFRNCWELVYAALSEIKRMHGDKVRIVAAGARYLPNSSDFIDMGLLDYRATGRLYRETDIGVTMQISRHPSYLPLELMASGVAMVAPDSDWFTWLFEDEENSLLSMRTVEDLVSKLDLLIRDNELRSRISEHAAMTIAQNHSSWDLALDHIYSYMCEPHASREGGLQL